MLERNRDCYVEISKSPSSWPFHGLHDDCWRARGDADARADRSAARDGIREAVRPSVSSDPPSRCATTTQAKAAGYFQYTVEDLKPAPITG